MHITRRAAIQSVVCSADPGGQSRRSEVREVVIVSWRGACQKIVGGLERCIIKEWGAVLGSAPSKKGGIREAKVSVRWMCS